MKPDDELHEEDGAGMQPVLDNLHFPCSESRLLPFLYFTLGRVAFSTQLYLDCI